MCSDLLHLWLSWYLWARRLYYIEDLIQVDLKLGLSLCPPLQECLELLFLLVQTQLPFALPVVFVSVEATVLILFSVLLPVPYFIRIQPITVPLFEVVIKGFERPLLFRNFSEAKLLDEEILDLFVLFGCLVAPLDSNHSEKDYKFVE